MLRTPRSLRLVLRRAVLVGATMLACGCSEPALEPPPETPQPATGEILDRRLAERIDQQISHLRHQPLDAIRWRDLAHLYHAHNLFDLAAECYLESLKLAPEEARPLFHLARIERRLGNLGAKEHLEQVTTLTDYAPAWWRLALWRLEDGETTAAREAAMRAQELAPKDRGAILVRARVEQQLGEPQTAADLLETHLASHPRDGDAHLLLGRAYQRLGRGDEASAHLALSKGAGGIYSDPWSDAVDALQSNFGAALRTATDLLGEDPRRGVTELEALRQERPENATVLTNLGIGYRRLGRLEDSVAILGEAVDRHPGRGLAHFQLAATCLELLRQPAENPPHELLRRTFRHIDRALELQPTVPRNHALKAELLALAGRPHEAIQAYRQAVAREPIDLAWLPRLGTLLCQIHRFREAIPVFEHHRERAGDTPEVLLLLGIAQANTGHLEAAAETLEQAHSLSPEDPSVRQALKQLYKARQGPAPPETNR